MPQTESYDLQTQQRMASSQGNQKMFGRFDPIHIGLAVCTIIFLILSIVFIILFATKHDGSTGYLVTGFSDKAAKDVSSDLKGLLNNKYTVNSFACDVQDKEVSAVFSLRGNPSVSDVEKVLAGSKTVTQTKTTLGDKATSVCRQQQLFPSTAPAVQSTTVSTQPPPTTVITSTTTASPPVIARYCKSNAISRDIVIVVDMNKQAKTNNDEKVKSLQTLRANLVSKLIFPQANVFLKAVVADKVQDVSNGFTSSGDQLNKDFDALFAISTATQTVSLDFDAVLKSGINGLRSGRAYVPGAIFVLTDKPLASAVTTEARETGVFVGVAGVAKNYINQFKPYADALLPYDTWTGMATEDPFDTLVCQYYSLPKPATSLFINPLELDDVLNSPKCEVLDIIIAFDTSESLSRIILPKYTDFAKRLVAQYKFKNDDFTRVGIISFNADVVEVLSLQNGNNLATVNTNIDSIVYTGGLTDVTKALNTANDMFTRESDGGRSRVLIVLSDAIPTVGTFADEIKAGQALIKNQVATFFVGYSSYTDDVKNELGQVTNINYVFGDMSDASFNGITQQILTAYPCPVPKCVTAYYAVEISEATDGTVVNSLKDVLAISSKAKTLQTGTESYQLITYNEGNINIFPQGDASFAVFQQKVQSLIDDTNQRDLLRGGHTRLDNAIDQITAELTKQTTKNSRFSSDIVFFGQANEAVLDPKDNEANLLVNAAGRLKSVIGGEIYAVDVSRDEANFGTDLWPKVTIPQNIIKNSGTVEKDLEGTSYFANWAKLSCALPALLTCFNTQVDVAVAVDLSKENDAFMSYISQLLLQFSTQDDAHISLLAYGSDPRVTVLSQLSAHTQQEVEDYSVVYEEWKNGSYFTTPAPTTSTTPPSTSTQKAKEFWETSNLYTVDTKMISGVFDKLSTQFGCGHYSDNGDRLFAPNLYIFASDNFDAYTTEVWDSFHTEVHNRFGCYDCPGSPNLLFLSLNDQKEVMAPAGLGQTVTLTTAQLDIDRTDDTSTQADINHFNSIVSSVCAVPFPTCATYTCVTN